MKVREASFDDYQQIDALSRRYDLENKSYDDWRHLWQENPLGQSLPMGWVLESPEKQLVGYLGNVPLAYHFQGRTLTAAATHVWVVDETARRHSVLLLNKYLNQKADLLLNTTANLEAQKIFEAFHATRVPARDYDTALFWITEPRGFAASVLKKKNVPMAGLLSIPAGVALSFKCPKPKIDPTIKQQTTFGPQFDTFWEALAQKSKTILADRSSRWLNWHFKNALSENRLWIFTKGNGDNIESYSLFLEAHAANLGLTRMRLVDYQSLDESNASLGPMIDVAIHKCRQHKIPMLESIGFGEAKRAVLESKNPLRRQLPSWQYFFKSKDAALMKELTPPHRWDPTIYDGDASL